MDFKKKWNVLSDEDKNKFAPICPEFIIEVRSKSDSLDDLIKKMSVWISNGAQLGWLIDPIEKNSYIFRSTDRIEKIEGFNRTIEAESIVVGFKLDLSLLAK